ncbi:hypothetical protein B0O80DRAFT_443762 [Mortierella sp. GBAus27b]|nr:hypothetical protein B0O80DRAFT_443762 [Mortierella sp. GBAus27b]
MLHDVSKKTSVAICPLVFFPRRLDRARAQGWPGDYCVAVLRLSSMQAKPILPFSTTGRGRRNLHLGCMAYSWCRPCKYPCSRAAVLNNSSHRPRHASWRVAQLNDESHKQLSMDLGWVGMEWLFPGCRTVSTIHFAKFGVSLASVLFSIPLLHFHFHVAVNSVPVQRSREWGGKPPPHLFGTTHFSSPLIVQSVDGISIKIIAVTHMVFRASEIDVRSRTARVHALHRPISAASENVGGCKTSPDGW